MYPFTAFRLGAEGRQETYYKKANGISGETARIAGGW
jgi:hypothetical protein